MVPCMDCMFLFHSGQIKAQADSSCWLGGLGACEVRVEKHVHTESYLLVKQSDHNQARRVDALLGALDVSPYPVLNKGETKSCR